MTKYMKIYNIQFRLIIKLCSICVLNHMVFPGIVPFLEFVSCLCYSHLALTIVYIKPVILKIYFGCKMSSKNAYNTNEDKINKIK